MENTTFKPHKVASKYRAAHIYVDKGDKTILKVYKGVLKTTMTAAFHFFPFADRSERPHTSVLCMLIVQIV